MEASLGNLKSRGGSLGKVGGTQGEHRGGQEEVKGRTKVSHREVRGRLEVLRSGALFIQVLFDPL